MQEILSQTPRTIAVFDFDATLIKGDSLWPFLVNVAGPLDAYLALAKTAFAFVRHFFEAKQDRLSFDARGFFKDRLLHALLAGRKVDALAPAIEQLRGWLKWNDQVLAALLDHYAKGHQIVIASGGLDLYLPALLRDLPPRALMCTRMEINDGVITGVMLSGNCVRQRKAEVLANYLEKNGPFVESWGYGNYPHDLAMLELLTHRIIIS